MIRSQIVTVGMFPGRTSFEDIKMFNAMNFPLSISLPNGSEFSASNLAAADQLMSMTHDFTDQARWSDDVKPRNHQDFGEAPVSHLEHFEIEIRSPLGDDGTIVNIVNVVRKWANFSRAMGNRGRRIAVVDTPVILDVNGEYSLVFNLLVGTDVWYNDRRMTIGFPASKSEWLDSLDNIVEHLEGDLFDSTFGSPRLVRVESSTFGKLNTFEDESVDGDEPLEDEDACELCRDLLHVMSDAALILTANNSRNEMVAALKKASVLLAVYAEDIELK